MKTKIFILSFCLLMATHHSFSFSNTTFEEIEGYKLHFVEKGEGQPVVLIHGAMGSHRDYTLTVFDEVAEKHHAFALDRPGFGNSSRPFGKFSSVEEQAQLIHELLKQRGIQNPIIVGHSFGGAVSLSYALQFPQDLKGLVLISPFVKPYEKRLPFVYYLPKIPLLGDALLMTVFIPLLKYVADDKLLEVIFAPNVVPESYKREMKKRALRIKTFRTNAHDIRNLKKSLRDMQPQLSELKMPVVLLHGDKDRVAPYEEHVPLLQENIRDIEIRKLEETGHHPLFSEAEAILAAIDITGRRPSGTG